MNKFIKITTKFYPLALIIGFLICGVNLNNYYKSYYSAKYTDSRLECTDLNIEHGAEIQVESIIINGKDYLEFFNMYYKDYYESYSDTNYKTLNIVENVNKGIGVKILYVNKNGHKLLYSEWFKKNELAHIEIKIDGRGVKITKSYG